MGVACPLSGGSEATNAPPRVFIELASMQGDLVALLRDHPLAANAPRPANFYDALAADPRVKQLTVHHVLGNNDASQTVAWELQRQDGSKEQLSMTVTPHVDGPTPAGVRVHVLGPGRAETTVVVSDQQSVVLGGGFASGTPAGTSPLGGQAEGSQTVLVLTPYVIWNEADLGRLYACKRGQGQAPAPNSAK